MGKRALYLFVALMLLPHGIVTASPNPQAAKSQTVPAGVNRINGYTAWDDEFFYVAVQVNKPQLIARNSAPFSQPLEDDAVVIAIQTDNDHKSTGRTVNSYTVAVSAVNGFQFYSGAAATPLFAGLEEFTARLKEIAETEKDPAEQTKKLLALQGRVLKVKVTQSGIERAGGGAAPGYTVEVAIPWVDLGGKPAPGAKMGFNVAAQSKAAGSPPLQSLAAAVRTSADMDNPSLWAEITFSNAPAPSTPTNLVSPRVFAQKPLIDGQLTNAEWNNLSLFTFGENPGGAARSVSLESVRASRAPVELRLRPAAPAVPVPARSAIPLPVAAHQRQSLPALIMAKWEYAFQADPRKSAPQLNVFKSDQSSALAHHPLEGSGAWFSYDRVDWHRRQLSDMRQAGVDVVLPVYRGGPRDRQIYSDKGLTVFASALRSMRQAGQDTPQVGLFLDADAVTQIVGERPSLKDTAARAALYELIRSFFLRIPEEFRLTIPLTSQNGGHTACLVCLSDFSAFKEMDSSAIAFVRGCFLRDFGHDLLVIGNANFKEGLDGYFKPTEDKTSGFDAQGWIRLATVGAGFDSILLDGASTTPSRRREQGYREGWTAALAQHPDLVLLDGWNDYARGCEIAPTLEIGVTGLDQTRLFSRAFAGSTKFGVKYLGCNAPDTLLAGARYKIDVKLQNTGLTAWGAPGTPAVSFRAQLLLNGAVISSSEPVGPAGIVSPGQSISVPLQIPVGSPNGTAPAEGTYALVISPVIQSEPSRTAGAERSLAISVRVAARGGSIRAWAATVLRSDLPLLMESGGAYTADAVLRNDGSAVWHKGDRIALRLCRLEAYGAATPETPVEAADASVALENDVPPGDTAHARLLLPLTGPAGKPLPAWSQDDLWTYAVRWEASPMNDGVRPASAGDAISGVSFGLQPIVVTEFDFGVRFTLDRTPLTLPADRKLPIILSVKNEGPQTWKRDQVYVGYHWYYLDGTELRWEDSLTALPQDIAPGAQSGELLVNLTAPANDGTYYLVWDMKFGDLWASNSAAPRAFDSQVHQVQIVGGKLVFADISKYFNQDGVADADNPTADFDGAGSAFAAEFAPPYTDMPVTPAALWLPETTTGPESPRRISFRWGPKDGKLNNSIACRGQRIEMGKYSGVCRVLHFAAASTDRVTAVSFKLIFQEPNGFSEDQYALTMSRWDRPPTHSEEVVLLARRHYEHGAVKPGAVALYRYGIKVRDPRKLVAIVLPDAPDIKIAAMTLER